MSSRICLNGNQMTVLFVQPINFSIIRVNLALITYPQNVLYLRTARVKTGLSGPQLLISLFFLSDHWSGERKNGGLRGPERRRCGKNEREVWKPSWCLNPFMSKQFKKTSEKILSSFKFLSVQPRGHTTAALN